MESLDIPNSFARLIHDPTRVVGFGIAAVVFLLLANYFQGNGLADGFDLVGIQKRSFSSLPSKWKFMTGSRDWLYANMARIQKAFYVYSLEGPVLILPARYIEEIKNRRTMSFMEWFRKSFIPHIPGFEAMKISLDTTILKDIVRTKLTQSLGPVSYDLCEQTNISVEKIYGRPIEWTPFNLRTHANELIAILSTRIFLGERLTHNKEWIRITVDYTVDLMLAVRTLKMFPDFLQNYIHWVIPHCIYVRRDRTNARKIIDEEIKTREAERADKFAKGLPQDRLSDSLGWMTEAAAGQPFDLSGAQLSLTFAAIHTTSDMVTKTLYFIAAYPEVATALREEAIHILKTEGWKKTSLTKMRFLDSLMKEVQRLYPAGIFSLPRYTTDDVKFHDGTVIPKGQICAVLTDNMRNPEIYKDPNTFDAWRFMKLADETGDRNHWQFVTTSPDHYGFGHGVHACPGRFFAANEIKIALVFMCLNFDFRVVNLEQRLAAGKEPVLCLGMDCVLDPSLKFEYRRREAEINPADYCVRE